MRTLLLICATALCALAPATVARAGMTVAGTGEPAFTKSATNTQWFHWEGSSSYEALKLEFDFYADNAFVKTESVNVSPSGSGDVWAGWTGVATLQEGHNYGICGYTRYTIGGVPARDQGSCLHGSQATRRTSTTIDRTKPSITVSIDDGEEFSRTGQLDYAIGYTDALSFPFPANFVCRDVGSDPASACQGGFDVDPACSIPAATNKVTSFACEDTLAQDAPDGPVTVCVIAADAAIPDNPNSSDQRGSASQANLSDRTCDSITLDRTAPSLTITAPVTKATVGDLVAFGASASDATSGLAGDFEWDFGDGSATDSGAAVNHTFTAPGTYEVTVAVTDAAGNPAQAKQAIVVEPRPVTENPGGGGGGGTPGTGGGGSPTATLDAITAKRVKLKGKARRLAVALSSDAAGGATLALVRNGRIHAKGAALLAAPGTTSAKLKLARGLKAGTYAVQITFTPANGAPVIVRSLAVKVVRRKRARASASASSRLPLLDVSTAPFRIPDGVWR